MKSLVPFIALALIPLISGCNSNMATHRKDFSPTKPSGAWNDYRKAVIKGEEPQAPKDLKDR